ncbi:MAG: GxxExxY protein [Anaerolineae bacterium]|nr:GxxExxY protein [Anaerolineae bacterium]
MGSEILYKELSYAIVGAAMEVHRVLGPGFLESVYQAALAHEFSLRGIPFEQFRRLPVTYKGVLVGEYIADFVVDETLLWRLKAGPSRCCSRSTGPELPGSHRIPTCPFARTSGPSLSPMQANCQINSCNSCNSWQIC